MPAPVDYCGRFTVDGLAACGAPDHRADFNGSLSRLAIIDMDGRTIAAGAEVAEGSRGILQHARGQGFLQPTASPVRTRRLIKQQGRLALPTPNQGNQDTLDVPVAVRLNA